MLIPLVMISACAITRYYRAPDLEGQLRGMRTVIDGNLAKVDSDYEEKRRFLESAKQGGADFSQSPFPKLAAQFASMTEAKMRSQNTAKRAREDLDALSKHLAGRDRVTSEDPAFGHIQRFEKSSEKLNSEVAASFSAYAESSRRFSELARESRLIPVDVPAFDLKLKKVIAEIDAQCALAERKIPEAEKLASAGSSSRDAERGHLLGEMRTEVVKIRGIQSDLETFRRSFLAASKGKSAYLVSPQHPDYPLFESLRGIQDRANSAVAAFNAKADSLKTP